MEPQAPYSGGIIAPISTEISIPPTGDLDFNLAVPEDGITYIVEYDPTPNDTTTPIKLKQGYFKNEWTGLTQIPVHDISDLF